MWRKPDEVPAEYISRITNVIPVLLAADSQFPVLGYFMNGRWRFVGGSQRISPLAWQPLPDMPIKGEL